MNATSQPAQEGPTEAELAATKIITLRAEIEHTLSLIRGEEKDQLRAIKLLAYLITLQSDLAILLSIVHDADTTTIKKAIEDLRIGNATPL